MVARVKRLTRRAALAGVDDGDDDVGFVRVARSQVGTQQDVIQRVGSAIIGGDFSGNARGDKAIDIQCLRDDETPEQVASGQEAVCIGVRNKASGQQCVAVGVGCVVGPVAYGVAVGYLASASGLESFALGTACQATAARASAVGAYASARVAKTTNIGGAIIVKAGGLYSNGSEVNWFGQYGGAEIVMFTSELDLKSVADYVMPLASGCHFFLSEVGIILTSLDTLTTQPTVRFGRTGLLDQQKAAGATTLLTAVGKREKWTPLVPQNGLASLSFGVTVGAVATMLRGRAYWKGLLVEDESAYGEVIDPANGYLWFDDAQYSGLLVLAGGF